MWYFPLMHSLFSGCIFTWTVPMKASMVALRDFKPYYNFGITESGLPNQLISGYFQGSSEKANQLCRKLGTVVLYNHSFFAWNFVNTDSTVIVLKANLEKLVYLFPLPMGGRWSYICNIFSSSVCFWDQQWIILECPIPNVFFPIKKS